MGGVHAIRIAHQGPGRAVAQRQIDECVPVEALAAQGDEQVAARRERGRGVLRIGERMLHAAEVQVVLVALAGEQHDVGRGGRADRVLVTSDNPRSEDPAAIIAEIAAGIRTTHEVEADRARAIEQAVLQANPRDVVLIAGKGHETYQEIAGRRSEFSDAEEAGKAIARRRA